MTQTPQAKFVLTELDDPETFLAEAKIHCNQEYIRWSAKQHELTNKKHVDRIDGQRALMRLAQEAKAAAALPSFVF